MTNTQRNKILETIHSLNRQSELLRCMRLNSRYSVIGDLISNELRNNIESLCNEIEFDISELPEYSEIIKDEYQKVIKMEEWLLTQSDILETV